VPYKKCAFYDSEYVEHLFLKCNFAKLVWQVVYFTFNIPLSRNIKNLFGNWLNGIDKITNARISIGVCAILRAIWNCWNDVIFNNANRSLFLSVIHKATYWITLWSFLLSEDQRVHMDFGCTHLMAISLLGTTCKLHWKLILLAFLRID
jgi:hypothetical protein